MRLRLRDAAAGGRRRRCAISAAAPLAGCREPLSPSVRTGDFPQGGKHNGPQRAMRQGGGRKKRALRAIDNSVFDTPYARLPNLGANCFHVGNLFASVSAEGFAYARAAACNTRRGRWPRPASLAPSGQFTFCPHRPAFGSCIGSIRGSTPTRLGDSVYRADVQATKSPSHTLLRSCDSKLGTSHASRASLCPL